MASLQEIRQQYPQYDDMPDEDLARALHGKYYSDMPFEEFSQRIGLAPEQPLSVTGDAFTDFQARLQAGNLRPVNAEQSTMGDMGQQFRAGLVEGTAGLAAFPQAVGTWLEDKASHGVDTLLGREHRPLPRFSAGVPSPGEVGQMAIEATGVGPAQTTSGRYARRFGQFLPGVVIGGPANMADKVLRAGTASVGTETASKAAEGKTLLGVDVQPYAEVVGGLLGGFAPDLARRIASPFPVNAERQRLLGVLDDEGVDLTAGQRTGRQGLRYAESELGGGRTSQVMERQGEQFTAAALRRAGITAERATPDVMDDAFTRLGNQFDDLASRTDVPLDSRLQNDLLDAVVDYQSVAGEVRPAAEQIINRISELAGQNNGILAGAAYKDIQSRIAKITRSQGADSALKEVVGSIREALDDAVERNLSGQILDDWRTVRTQYRNLKTLEQAAAAGGQETAEGLISPSQLRSATVHKQGRGNYVRGRGDFADLARAGEATMRALPQSGTAPRLMVRAAGATAPTILGTILGGASGIPGGQIVGGLLGSAVPFIEGRVLMSRPVQAWLGNQRLAPSRLPVAQRALVPLLGSGVAVTNPKN